MKGKVILLARLLRSSSFCRMALDAKLGLLVLFALNGFFTFHYLQNFADTEVIYPEAAVWLPLSHQECIAALHKSGNATNFAPDLDAFASYLGSEPLLEPFVREQSTLIPPIIHQIHTQSRLKKDWSYELRRRFESWDKVNPGNLHFIWDEDQAHQFVQFYFNQRIRDAYARLPRVIHKTDMLRYLLLYYYGGYYADSDTWCYRPTKEWAMEYTSCNATFIVGIEWDWEHTRKGREKMEIVQWSMASAPRHPILRAVINMVAERSLSWPMEELQNVDNVLEFAGPLAWTDRIQRFLQLHGRDMNEMHIIGKNEARLFPGGVLLLPVSAFNWPQEAFEHSSRALLQHFFAGFGTQGWRYVDV